jgi:hypothetical protein
VVVIPQEVVTFVGERTGGPSLHCTIPREGAPSLRFLQEPALSLSKGRVAMPPAQLLLVPRRNLHSR